MSALRGTFVSISPVSSFNGVSETSVYSKRLPFTVIGRLLPSLQCYYRDSFGLTFVIRVALLYGRVCLYAARNVGSVEGVCGGILREEEEEVEEEEESDK